MKFKCGVAILVIMSFSFVVGGCRTTDKPKTQLNIIQQCLVWPPDENGNLHSISCNAKNCTNNGSWEICTSDEVDPEPTHIETDNLRYLAPHGTEGYSYGELNQIIADCKDGTVPMFKSDGSYACVPPAGSCPHVRAADKKLVWGLCDVPPTRPPYSTAEAAARCLQYDKHGDLIPIPNCIAQSASAAQPRLNVNTNEKLLVRRIDPTNPRFDGVRNCASWPPDENGNLHPTSCGSKHCQKLGTWEICTSEEIDSGPIQGQWIADRNPNDDFCSASGDIGISLTEADHYSCTVDAGNGHISSGILHNPRWSIISGNNCVEDANGNETYGPYSAESPTVLASETRTTEYMEDTEVWRCTGPMTSCYGLGTCIDLAGPQMGLIRSGKSVVDDPDNILSSKDNGSECFETDTHWLSEPCTECPANYHQKAIESGIRVCVPIPNPGPDPVEGRMIGQGMASDRVNPNDDFCSLIGISITEEQTYMCAYEDDTGAGAGNITSGVLSTPTPPTMIAVPKGPCIPFAEPFGGYVCDLDNPNADYVYVPPGHAIPPAEYSNKTLKGPPPHRECTLSGAGIMRCCGGQWPACPDDKGNSSIQKRDNGVDELAALMLACSDLIHKTDTASVQQCANNYMAEIKKANPEQPTWNDSIQQVPNSGKELEEGDDYPLEGTAI